MGPVRRDRPEVAIEWLDVTIDIKVREPFSCKKGDAVSVVSILMDRFLFSLVRKSVVAKKVCWVA
jgi:hypothetical protein